MTIEGADDPAAPMATGAREAKPSRFARLVSRAMSRDLRAFVVPGEDVARARGLDLGAAGLRVSDTPRHASVLVLVGELPPSLKRAAAVAYAQMPRPRTILAVGAEDCSPLPDPDASTIADQRELARGVEKLSLWFSENSFRDEVSDFDADAVRTRTEYTCTMHPEIVRDEPGSCPICGMDLVPRESAGGMGHDDGSEHGEHGEHGSMHHGEHEDDGGDAGGYEDADDMGGHGSHEGMDHGEHEGDGNDTGGHEESGGMDHGGHGGMDHGDMGFMSMVEMTKDLPRSRDGLPMERVESPFGPLFPGLPGGLSLSLTLDGDAVARAEATSVVAVRNLEGPTGPAESFVVGMARLDPFSPVAYRVLALRALEDAMGAIPEERTSLARVSAMERERAASHLGWLANLGRMLGHERLASRAAHLQLALLRAVPEGDASRLRADEAGELAELRTQTNSFVKGVRRTPFLKRRLDGVATLPQGADASGPVARARGISADARANEDSYRSLGFEPVIREGDDALARARVRMAEIERSLDLALATGPGSLPECVFDPGLSGKGEAAVETPRGSAAMKISLKDGAVSEFELWTPSTQHLRLVQGLADDQELAEFLVGVASLDVSPWEVTL